VGAGVSKAVKFKNGKDAFINWKELLESFIPHINQVTKVDVIKALLNDNPIDYLEIADKIQKILSINYFNKVLNEAFDIDYNAIDKETYSLAKSIWNLNSNLIITTNYDKVLDRACEDENISNWDIESIHEQGNYLRDGASKPIVWNLHGHIDKTDNIILSTDKYNEFYTQDIEKSKYRASLTTLQTVISSNSLLFIGFSLDDEFVKNQINRTIDIFGGNSCEHYILIKKGTKVDTLNGNIKVIEYEEHGQPLIDKLNFLKPSPETLKPLPITNPVLEKEYTTRYLTTQPPKNENFIGRVDDLQTIETQLDYASIIYIVNGIGGVGKSELSCEYFHRNKHKYKSVAFMEFTKDTSSIEELFYVKFKEQFNLNEDSTLDSIIQKLQGLEEKNLLLLDNLESIEDFEKIKALNTNFDLLITTRRTDINAVHQLPLDTLNDADAKELFLSIYNEDQNIEDILEYLDNHPLFINLTTKSLQRGYIILEELRDEIENGNIYKIDSKDDKTFQQHLEDRFSKQFSKEENEELKELLQILSIFPSIEIDFKILEKSIGQDKLRVKLQKLVERGWLSKKENSYKLHQIIKLFIQTGYALEYEEITFVFDNIVNYINPDDATLIVSQLNVYIPITELFLNLYQHKKDNIQCELLDSITYLYYSLGQYDKSLAYQKQALNLRASLFGMNTKQIARSYYLLGVVYLTKNSLKLALDYQSKSLEIQEDILDNQDISLARSYDGIASIHSAMGAYSLSLINQNKAIRINEKNPTYSTPDLAISYTNLSTIYGSQGRLKKSLNYQLIGIKDLERIFSMSHPVLVRQYGNLAKLYIEFKECINAKLFLLKAIAIIKQLDYSHPDEDNIVTDLKLIEFNIKKQNKAGYKKKGKYCKSI